MTQWKACVGGGGTYNIFFYVFRPTEQSNCYELVGRDSVSDATPTNGCVTLDVSASFISVQPGDVVGVLPISNEVDSGIEIDANATSITAWYTSIDTLDTNNTACPYEASLDGNLDSSSAFAPVITTVIGMHICDSCVICKHTR